MAKQIAERNGGYLVIIDNYEENQFVFDTYRTTFETGSDILC